MSTPFKVGPGQTLRLSQPTTPPLPAPVPPPPEPPAPPGVNFEGSPLSGLAPLLVTFTDLSSGEPTAWDWDFGDSATSTIQNPNHIYADPGVYDVSLSATGPGGVGSLTKVGYVTVNAPPAPPPPAPWADPFQSNVYVRIEGGVISDASSTGTPVTATGGSGQIAIAQGLGGFDALHLSASSGYVKFPSPADINGSTITMTVEAWFKPVDYANWTICGPETTGTNVFSIVCIGNVLKYGLGDLNSNEWSEIDLTSINPAIISPTVLNAEGFWHIEVSTILVADTGYLNVLKLNGYLPVGNVAYSGSGAVSTAGNMVLGFNANIANPNSNILLNEFRIYRGFAAYGTGLVNTTQAISRYSPNARRWSNSTGLGAGWDQATSGRYNNSSIPPPVLTFADSDRTVLVGYDDTHQTSTNNGSQGFAKAVRTDGGKRYFEIVVPRWSSQTSIGVMAVPTATALNQTTPYAAPGDYYLLQLDDGGSGSVGHYTAYSDPSAIFDNFFNPTSNEGTFTNDTFGFFVDMDAGRVDKVMKNGTQQDAAPLTGTRLNTKTWTSGWKVVPYYNARPGGEGVVFMLITAGEFRYPPTGPDAVYLPWDPAPALAEFVGTPLTGLVPLSVNFTDYSSPDPTSWAWDFGDSGTSSAQNPTHVYTSTGTYNVSLLVMTPSGSASKLKNGYIVVTTPPASQAFATAHYQTPSGPSPFPPGSDLDFRWNYALSNTASEWVCVRVEVGTTLGSSEVFSLSAMKPGSSAQPYGVLYQESAKVNGGITDVFIPDVSWSYHLNLALLNAYPDRNGQDASWACQVISRDDPTTPQGLQVTASSGSVVMYWYWQQLGGDMAATLSAAGNFFTLTSTSGSTTINLVPATITP